jgi:hypothetical protein
MPDRPVPRDEMPFLPIRRRSPGHASPPQFDELLENGADPTSDAAWQRVSEVFGSAAADPTPAELTVDSAALAAFRRAHLGAPTRRQLVRSNMITTLLSSKIAGAIACAAIGVTGAAGAAYANVLPRPIQNIAHNTIGAPPTHADSDRHGGSGHDDGVAVASASASLSPTLTPSPSASASVAAARLCDEWSDVAERSSDDNATNVHDQLAALAGGAGNIAAFCATVGADSSNDEHHSASATPSPTATTSAGDDQRDGRNDDPGDDHGRDGASATPNAQTPNAQSPNAQSPSQGSDDGDGPGKDNSGNNDGSGNNSGSGNNGGSGSNGDH